ncbi:MAG: SIMPL domain-containing protein [Bacteroidales bacterium]
MKRLILLASFIFFLSAAIAQEKNFIDENYIEVAGRAEKEYAPDKIFLEITITEKDSKGKSSIEKQEKDLFKRFTAIGIDISKNVQIKDINTSLEKYLLRKNTILMTKSYIVIVNGTPQLIALFEQMEQASITDINITKAELSNFEEAGREVMAMAAVNAKKSAEAVAEALGRKVGKAIFIQSYASFPRSLYLTTSYKRALDSNVAGELSASESQPDFQKIKLEHQVTVRFSLE